MTDAERPGRIATWYLERRAFIQFCLAVGGAIAVAGILIGVFPYGERHPVWGTLGDASAYWTASRSSNPYDWQPGMAEFRYSPAFLWLIAPISWLPWNLFALVWVALHLAVVAWFRAPWLLAFPPVVDDIVRGNISLFLAAMIVVSFRYSAVWAFGLLTKVTPGIGVLWHLARQEWRNLTIALVVTAAVVVVGVLVDRALWLAWVESIGVNGVHEVNQVVPLPFRLIAAAVIGLVAGVRGEPRWMAVGVAVAMPTLWLSSLAVLAAWVPLSRRLSTQAAPAP